MVALLSVKGAVQQGGSHPKGQSERSAVDMDARLIFATLHFLLTLSPLFFSSFHYPPPPPPQTLSRWPQMCLASSPSAPAATCSWVAGSQRVTRFLSRSLSLSIIVFSRVFSVLRYWSHSGVFCHISSSLRPHVSLSCNR